MKKFLLYAICCITSNALLCAQKAEPSVQAESKVNAHAYQEVGRRFYLYVQEKLQKPADADVYRHLVHICKVEDNSTNPDSVIDAIMNHIRIVYCYYDRARKGFAEIDGETEDTKSARLYAHIMREASNFDKTSYFNTEVIIDLVHLCIDLDLVAPKDFETSIKNILDRHSVAQDRLKKSREQVKSKHDANKFEKWKSNKPFEHYQRSLVVDAMFQILGFEKDHIFELLGNDAPSLWGLFYLQCADCIFSAENKLTLEEAFFKDCKSMGADIQRIVYENLQHLPLKDQIMLLQFAQALTEFNGSQLNGEQGVQCCFVADLKIYDNLFKSCNNTSPNVNLQDAQEIEFNHLCDITTCAKATMRAWLLEHSPESPCMLLCKNLQKIPSRSSLVQHVIGELGKLRSADYQALPLLQDVHNWLVAYDSKYAEIYASKQSKQRRVFIFRTVTAVAIGAAIIVLIVRLMRQK